MKSSKPADRPDTSTVKVRQGTGPRIMVSVLLLSLLAAIVLGAVLLYYFIFMRPAVPPPGL